MHTIVIATDGSASSREAVAYGLDLALESEAEVVFVHVVPNLHVVPLNGYGAVGAVPHEPSTHDSEVLEQAQRVAQALGVPARTKLLRGNTVDEIVACADNLDADLIVVGSRGHGRLANALLGSVSRGVLHESKRPVTVIRGSDMPAAEAAR